MRSVCYRFWDRLCQTETAGKGGKYELRDNTAPVPPLSTLCVAIHGQDGEMRDSSLYRNSLGSLRPRLISRRRGKRNLGRAEQYHLTSDSQTKRFRNDYCHYMC